MGPSTLACFPTEIRLLWSSYLFLAPKMSQVISCMFNPEIQYIMGLDLLVKELSLLENRRKFGDLFQPLKKVLINNLSEALSLKDSVNLWYLTLSPKAIYPEESTDIENNRIKFLKHSPAVT